MLYKRLHMYIFPLFSFLVNISLQARRDSSDTTHGLADLALPIGAPLEAVGRGLEIHHGLVDGLLGGGDEGAVLDDVLVEGLAGEDDEAGGVAGTLLNVRGDLVAALLEDDVVVRRDGLARGFAAVRERHGPLERVRERVPPLRQLLLQLAARLQRHVQQPHGRVREVFERLDPQRLARDDFDLDFPVVRLRDRDLPGPEIAVPRLARLQVLRQIHPQLHPDVDVFGLHGHFRVHDALAGGHEL